MATKKRKICDEHRFFNNSWVDLYFFVEHKGKPLCLICQKTVAVMKEFNIKRHYDSEHKSTFENIIGDLRKIKVNHFKSLLNSQQNIFKKQISQNKSIVRASYVVSQIISKNNRPFTDAEFIKKCMLAVVDEICPDKKKDFEDISLSARTCVRRTEELGNNLMQQLKDKINSFNFFSLAMDESTDVCDTAQLLIFIRGIDDNFNVYEELADLCSLKGTTTGEDLFESIDKSLNNLGLEWKKLVSVTTDGGKNMSGSNKGVVGRIKKKMLQNDYEIPMNFHCIIHQEALCCKVLACQEVMSVVISSIHFIRKNGLGHRQFQHFLDEIESEYGDVIYFSEVRWLSRGAALKRFFDLRLEIEMFMNEKNKIVSELSDESWILELAFLTDITTFLNELNIKLQGKGKLLSDMYTDIKSFQVKLKLLYNNFDQQILYHFSCCKSAIESFVKPLQWDLIKPKFLNIIEQLQNEFSTRFDDFYKYDKEIKLFQNPFQVDINNVKNNLQMEVIELQNDEVLKNSFREATSLPQFYSCLPITTFPGIRQFAQKLIAAFASTYICEQTFSIVKYRKSKHSSRLSDEHLRAVLRVSTTSLQADIENITNKLQAQKSH